MRQAIRQPAALVIRRRRIVELLANGMKRGDACATAGVARATFQRWLKTDAEFRAAVQAAEERYIASVYGGRLWRDESASSGVESAQAVPEWVAVLVLAFGICVAYTLLFVRT